MLSGIGNGNEGGLNTQVQGPGNKKSKSKSKYSSIGIYQANKP